MQDQTLLNDRYFSSTIEEKKKNVEKTLKIDTQKRVVCDSTLAGSINIIFFHVFLSFFRSDDDAMMIIPLLYALVLHSFVGRFALINIAVDRVCDGLFQAGERACKATTKQSKNAERKQFYTDCVIKNIFHRESHTYGPLRNDCLVSKSLWINTEISAFSVHFCQVLWEKCDKAKDLDH